LNLRHFSENFQISVALFEFLERGGGAPSVGVLGGIFTNYRIIAARDGALNIYHFKCSLVPHCDNIRNAVAHAGDVYKNQYELKRNQQRTGHAGISDGAIFTHSLYERIYSVGKEGSVFSLTLDQASIEKLFRIVQLIDAAFH
jgi:hypothetical protein